MSQKHSSVAVDLEDLPEPLADAIAIVGLAGRFPGADDISTYWSNLREGVESVRFWTPEELEDAGIPPLLARDPGYVPALGALSDIAGFDAGFFGFNPRVATTMDPQQRLFLECCWHALEDAAVDASRFDGPIAVYGGASLNSYLLHAIGRGVDFISAVGDLQAAIGNRTDHLAPSVAYRLGLKGPAVTVQTTCSTSLVAVHLACQALLDYQTDLAIAGGVRVQVPQEGGYVHETGGIFSPDGHCRPFDAAAAGTLNGNGVGTVVLARLEDALTQGLPVRALILGSAINNDGDDKVGYTAPSVDGQAQVIALAQGIAGVTPREISYIETHGTATPLGDPIEIAALRRVFSKDGDSGRTTLGAVKSNFGHLDTAAGIAGLIKTVLAMEARELPPTLHFQQANAALELEASGFEVSSQLQPWEAPSAGGRELPRRAGVSSFGIGGTNAHLVLEEAPEILRGRSGGESREWQMLLLSARSSAALEDATQRFATFLAESLEERQGVSDEGAEGDAEQERRELADIAYTLKAGRRPFEFRRAVLCRSLEEAVQHFQSLDPRHVFTSLREPRKRPLVFLLPGQGSQHPGMLAELYRNEAETRRWLDRGAEVLAALPADLGGCTDLLERIFDGDAEALRRTDLAQPALFIVEYALARQWMEWGVAPSALLGHSIGEYVAAALAEVFTFEQGLRLVARRGQLVQSLPGGSMVSVHADENRLQELLATLRREGHILDLAAINRPGVGVVAGSEGATAALRQRLEEEGWIHRALHTSHAFHSAMMEPAQEGFRRAFEGIELQAPKIPFVSNVSGEWIRDEEATSPDYWVRHLRATVRFSQGLEQVLEEASAVLLEVGPNTHLATLARQHPARGADHVVLSSQRHAREEAADVEALLTAAARLWLAGVPLNWETFYAQQQRLRRSLPGYPFEHRRYWIEAGAAAPGFSATAGAVAPGGRAADPAHWFYLPAWRRAPLSGDGALPTSVLLLTAEEDSPSARLGQALEERLRAAGADVRRQALVLQPAEGADGLPAGERRTYESLLAEGPNSEQPAPERIVSLLAVSGDEARHEAAAQGMQRYAFDAHFLLLQALAEGALGGEGDSVPRLEVVTDGAQEVLGGELRWPEKALVQGPVRVGPKEIPGLVTRAVDLEPGLTTEDFDSAADRLLAEWRQPEAAGAIVAWRGDRRWQESFESAPLAPPAASSTTGSGDSSSPAVTKGLRPGGVVLLTGGFGGMGRTFAAELIRQVQARIVLVGRRDPSTPAYGEVVEELEALGGEVLALQGDIGSPGAWEPLLDAVEERFGALHGVVHAAGVPPTSPLMFKTLEEAREALGAKVAGTLDLDAAIARRPWAADLDFVLLCSSRAAFLAPPASVDYTSANAFLDAFALHRASSGSEGPAVLAVNWCGWRDVGMLAAAAQSGDGPVDPAVGRPEPVDYPFFDRRFSAAATASRPAVHTFELEVSPRTHWLLDDHRIGGHAVVAGTTYLELARAAAVELGLEGPMDLVDVFFLTPVRLRDEESRTLRVKLEERGDGGYDVEAASRILTEGEDRWENTVVFQLHPAEVHPEEGSAAQTDTEADAESSVDQSAEARRARLEELRRRTSEGRSVAAVEDELREDLGPRWQNVAQVFHGDQEVLGVMELGAPYHGDLEAMRLHPSLLDRAVSLGVNYLAGDVPDEFYLPMAYRRIRVLEDLPARFLAHVRRIDTGTQEKETLSFAVTLLSEEGQVLVDIDHFSRKRVSDAWAQLRDMVAKEGGTPATGASASPVAGAAASEDSGGSADEALRSALSPEEGADAFLRLLGALDRGRAVVSPTHLDSDRAAAAAVRAEDFATDLGGDSEEAEAHPRTLDTEYVAPSSALEEILASLWSQALGVSPVGVQDNYFELGGDSVLGVQIIARARSQGVEILPNQLFEYQTIAELAAVLAASGVEVGEGAAPAGPPLEPRSPETPLPLSLSQQRLWFLHSLDPHSPAYHLSCPLRLDGELRHRELARCLADIVTRHEALRTRFESRQGWPSQVVAPAPAGDALPLPVVDVSGVPDPQGLADQILEQATRRPFALEESAPFRTLLVRVAAEAADFDAGAAAESVRGHHLAIFVLHHIIADGWSIGVLVGELGALYRARLAGDPAPVAALPALPVQYGDYTLWQQRRAAEGAFDADVDWWREALAEMPPRLELPADGPAPRAGEDASSSPEDEDSASDDRGVTLDLRYPEPLARALEALARSCDTTLFTVALAAFDALAARLAGQDKVVVGVPVANRERAEIADLIGLFINTLPIPLDLGGDPSFRELVARAKRSSLDAFSHQEAPLEKVAEAVRADGGGREGLFSVLFGFQNAPMETLQLPGLELSTPAADRGTAMFDWTLVFYETSAALTGWIAYRAQRFDAATMARFEARFGALLTAVAENPELPLSRLPVMAEEERRQLLAAAGDGLPVGSAAAASSLIHRFAAQAAANPQGIAVSSSQGAWTYGQLAILAAGGAAALRSAGVGPGRRVALAYERGLEAVAAQLATLAAGASYLPLDPSQPHSRVANIVADGAPSLILVGPDVASPAGLAAPSRAHQEVFAEAAERAQLDGAAVDGAVEALGEVAVGPEHPAYLLFTSGSTGRPKGVMVPHGAVLALLGSCEDWLAPGAEDRWSVFHSLAFDFSVWEIWGALAFGGRAVMVSRDVARSPALFLDLLESEGVSVLSQTPGAFRRLDSADADRGAGAPALTALRAITFGGEALDPGQLRSWRSRRPAVELINLYGITETTVHVTRHTLGETDLRLDGRSPIGEALEHLSLHVVDTHPGAAQEPAPAGAVGELVVGGAGLAQGYAGDPARTAERFVPDPHADSRRPGARLYRSGDLGRRRADGGVDYLGRRDRQLKVRGYRIEAGEVEAAAASHGGLAVAVADVATVAGEPSLVVWATAAPASEADAPNSAAPDLATLRQEMAQRVPEYMLPSRLVMLESLPLTSSGKIDRRALPHPESSAAHGVAPTTAHAREPADALELYLAQLYAEVLDIPRPGVTEAFFDLGGHSVAAAVLVNRIQQRLGAIVHVVAIFDAPTVESLAEYLRQRHPQAVAQHFGAGGESSATAALRSAASPVDEAALERLAALVPPLEGGERRAKNPPAVFVLAPPRSGTTLLRVMLAGHPQLFAPPELELLSFPDLASRRAAFDNERDRFWLEGLVRAGMEALDTDAAGAEAWVESLEARDASTAEAYGALQELLTAPGGRRLLVDKTPSYALHPSILQRAEEIFDGAYFIHLLRHPQGMVRSFDDAGLDEIFFRFDHRLPRRALAEGLWTLSQRNILDFLQGIPEERHTAVSFEELVRSPVETMERLCAFLDLPFEAAMADPYGANSSARMTDGPRPESRMLGDVKLLEHRGIDPAAADRWRQDERLAPLSAATAKTAAGLGYVDLGVDLDTASASGDSSLTLFSAGAPSEVQLDAQSEASSEAQRWPLAPAQERLWFLHQLAPESPAYNVPASMTLSGALDVSALAWALERVEERHGALRTVFDHDVEGFPGPSQRVRPPRDGGRFALPVVDLSALAPQRAEEEARRLASAEALAPFDLATGPMLRARLLRLPPQDGMQSHGALLTVHHAVADGWSLRLLVADFGELYASRVEGRGARLQPLPVSYGAYAAHLRQELESGSLVAALERRVEALRGTPVLELATDRPRPRVASSEGSRIPLHWPAALVESAAAFGRRRGATPFMVILAAYSALLGRLSRQRDFAVGVPEAGRLHQEVEGVVGLFVNILAMRLDLGAAAGGASPSFEDLLERVRGASRDAFEDREVPLEQIVEVIQPQRDPSREPLCQVALAYQNLPSGELQLPNLEVGTLETGTAAAKFDLLLTLSELPGEGAEGILEGALDWRTDLFDAATAQRIAAQLQRLLERALESPQQPVLELPLSDASEAQHLLTYEGAAPRAPGGARELAESALEMVARRVAESPQGLAVDGDFGRLTYAELWRRVEARACALRAAGIGAGSRVAVLAAGTPEMLEGQLAVLAAGAAYVPLDPRHPAERLAAVAVAALAPPRAASRPVALLAGGHGVSSELRRAVAEDLERGLAETPGAAPWTVDLETDAPAPSEGELRSLRSLPRPHPLQEAYLIFTSGSTGTPKATVMTQRNLARFVATQGPVFGIGAGRRMLQMASPAFDAAVMEVFVPLVEGSTVVLGRRETLAAGPDLEQALQRLAVDVLFITPSVLALLDAAALPDLAVVLCGGEACPAPLAARWSRGRRWVHVYGPTECTIITLGHPFALDSDGDSVADALVAPPLGRGLPGVEVLLVDDALLPAPPGAVAEIALAGAVLSRGYEGRPALTAETFVPHPHPQRPGQRLYRTGDLARLAGDDTLRFHGRRDRQVQVRGVRVEPGEVEAAVVRLPGVRDAAVEGYGEGSNFRLAAWVVPEGSLDDAHRELAAWRETLRHELPEVLVPDAFVLMETLPRGTSGKVDRSRLPQPVAGAGSGEAVAPRSEREVQVAAVWRELLEVETVGVETPFFDLGGHSLLATRVVSRLREASGLTLTLRDFFDAPTVAGLAQRLEELAQGGAESVEAAETAIPVAERGDQDLESLLDELGAVAALPDGGGEEGGGE
ncbi:MAG: amino acid adenylation domain-containing protein [Acidobacteriota bacterium]